MVKCRRIPPAKCSANLICDVHPWAAVFNKLLSSWHRACPVRSGPGARTSVRSGPVRSVAGPRAYLVYLWFDSFWTGFGCQSLKK